MGVYEVNGKVFVAPGQFAPKQFNPAQFKIGSVVVDNCCCEGCPSDLSHCSITSATVSITSIPWYDGTATISSGGVGNYHIVPACIPTATDVVNVGVYCLNKCWYVTLGCEGAAASFYYSGAARGCGDACPPLGAYALTGTHGYYDLTCTFVTGSGTATVTLG
jgi:hypothetical protein